MEWWFVPRALWLFLPSYCANMVPVAAARIVPRWNARLDAGRTARDGRPLLGANKTWRGLVAGLVVGAVAALLLAMLAFGPVRTLDFGRAGGASWWRIAAFGGIVGTMTLVGDATKSYVKRRLDRPAGASWFPFDQLDGVVGGLAGAFLASPLLPGWALTAYFGSPWTAIALLVVSPLLHWLSSVGAYAAGWKANPW